MSKAPRKKFTYDYPRPAVTVDVAIVSKERRPRILLICRKNPPYQGRWALPGGFVNEDEALHDAARRELREETGVDADDIEQLQTFGDPGRDPRGHVVTIVYLARLDAKKVKPVAADDAAEVGWFLLDELPPLAFDHREIIALARSRLQKRRR